MWSHTFPSSHNAHWFFLKFFVETSGCFTHFRHKTTDLAIFRQKHGNLASYRMSKWNAVNLATGLLDGDVSWPRRDSEWWAGCGNCPGSHPASVHILVSLFPRTTVEKHKMHHVGFYHPRAGIHQQIIPWWQRSTSQRHDDIHDDIHDDMHDNLRDDMHDGIQLKLYPEAPLIKGQRWIRKSLVWPILFFMSSQLRVFITSENFLSYGPVCVTQGTVKSCECGAEKTNISVYKLMTVCL